MTRNITELNRTIPEDLERELEIYLKCFVILFADDTVLLAETAQDLQTQLNAFHDYCKAWNLKGKLSKLKS